MDWIKANGGPLALVVLGLTFLGFQNKWVGWICVVVGALGWVGQVGWRAGRRPRHPEQPAVDSPAIELATPEHREALRTILEGISHHIQANRAHRIGEPWQLAIEAHYPQLARMLAAWNPVAERRIEAPKRLSERFDTEVTALSLEDDFHVRTIIDGFAALTAHRAISGQLHVGLSRQQLWDVWRVTSAPLDGVRLKAAHEVAITMPVASDMSNDDYNAMADGLIDQIEPTFWAAQDWPEAREVAEADQALAEFDPQPIFDEINRLKTPSASRFPPIALSAA